MTDSILTIVGTTVFVPFVAALIRTHWNKQHWSRQVLLLLLLLHGISVLYIPLMIYISAACLLAALIVYLAIERPPFRFSLFMGAALLYSAWFAVSLLWSPMPRKGAQFLVDNGLPLLGMALAGSTVQLTKDEYTKGLHMVSYSALVFIGWSVVAWALSCVELQIWPWNWPFMSKECMCGEEPFKWVYRWLGGLDGYTHPSYNLLPLFAVLSLAIPLRKQGSFSGVCWWLMWCGTLLLTLLTQSRMGLVFCALVLAAYMVLMQLSLRRQLIMAGMIAVFALSVSGSTWSFWKAYGQDPNREILTNYTWRYIQAKPWTGAGAGALNPIEICHVIGEDTWPHVGYISPEADPTHWWLKSCMMPHNEWLTDWAHGGVVAALCSMLLYLVLAGRCVRKKRGAEGVFLLIFILLSFLEPPLYIGKGLYIFCYLAALLYTTERL